MSEAKRVRGAMPSSEPDQVGRVRNGCIELSPYDIYRQGLADFTVARSMPVRPLLIALIYKGFLCVQPYQNLSFRNHGKAESDDPDRVSGYPGGDFDKGFPTVPVAQGNIG
jgi:hypothetical protein